MPLLHRCSRLSAAQPSPSHQCFPSIAPIAQSSSLRFNTWSFSHALPLIFCLLVCRLHRRVDCLGHLAVGVVTGSPSCLFGLLSSWRRRRSNNADRRSATAQGQKCVCVPSLLPTHCCTNFAPQHGSPTACRKCCAPSNAAPSLLHNRLSQTLLPNIAIHSITLIAFPSLPRYHYCQTLLPQHCCPIAAPPSLLLNVCSRFNALPSLLFNRGFVLPIIAPPSLLLITAFPPILYYNFSPFICKHAPKRCFPVTAPKPLFPHHCSTTALPALLAHH